MSASEEAVGNFLELSGKKGDAKCPITTAATTVVTTAGTTAATMAAIIGVTTTTIGVTATTTGVTATTTGVGTTTTTGVLAATAAAADQQKYQPARASWYLVNSGGLPHEVG